MRWTSSFVCARHLAALLFLGVVTACQGEKPSLDWAPEEIHQIESLWLGQLPPLPRPETNSVADDPRAVKLGHALFFDTGLSANASVACASCHKPELQFTDGRARSFGIAETPRKSMSIVGSAYSPWLFWDGRRDSLWSQALEPLEDPREHGMNRVALVRLIASNGQYRAQYTTLFGPLPDLQDRSRFPDASPRGTPDEQAAWATMSSTDRVAVSTAFANLGRALESYQRQLQFGPAPFDRFAEAVTRKDWRRANLALTRDQQEGLRLFIGRANCIHCHNGPLFTNNEFHNTGLEGPGMLPPDRGRVEAMRKLLADEFHCLGPYSGARDADCAELRFVKSSGIELVGAFRTVSLRNIADHPPYMHTGQFATLEAVIHHYNRAQPTIISDELQPLDLSPTQMNQLAAFLRSLSGPLKTPPSLLAPPNASLAARVSK